jgi:hypothetical protein
MSVAPHRATRPHRRLVPTVLALATVIGFFACFAVWANRQALNTDNWTNTSSKVLADPHVQTALSAYLVNELFTSAEVPGRLQTALPEQLKGLSGPLSAGLRQVANQVVPRLLATSAAEELWRRSNHAAHEQLLRILNGGGKAVSTENGVVALNLHELVTELGNRLGVGSQVAAAREKLASGQGAEARSTAEKKLGVTLPANTGRLVIMRSNQLQTAQDIVKAIKGLALVLPLVALALFALAVWLARGWRRHALRSSGWCFFGVGIALLVLRRVAGQAVVKGLVANPANNEAAQAVWSIGTSLLYDIAIAMVLYGLALVLAAWLAGETRSATFLRRAGAPWMREHALGSYVVAGIVLLLVVLWGPTPATRQLLPVLGFFALAALGVSVLRRQAALEFPNAMHGEAMADLRRAWPFGRHAREEPRYEAPARNRAPGDVEAPTAPVPEEAHAAKDGSDRLGPPPRGTRAQP